MRMRKKAWARPELATCTYYTDKPYENIGKWKEMFINDNPIHVELGCGKGVFLANIAPLHKNINYIGIDISCDVLGVAKRNIDSAFQANEDNKVENVMIVKYDIERILEMFNSDDKIERLYINFCNPWPKERHKKRRLTHSRKLNDYKKFITKSCEIHFKTDDDELFAETLDYLKETGFKVNYITYDLHSSDYKESPETEHEIMFTNEGIKTKFLIASLVD